MTFQAIDEPRGVYMRFFDFVAPFELMEGAEYVAAFPPERCYAICDFIDMDEESIFAWTHDMVASIAAHDRKVYAHMTWPFGVVLLGRAPKVLDLCHAYKKADPPPRPPSHQIGVFTEMDEARAWLTELFGDLQTG